MFEQIKEIIAETVSVDPEKITLGAKLSDDLGIDSLDTVELLMDLEDAIGREIELDEKVETVGDLVRFIESKEQE